jgi:hypothetical protein
MVKLDMSNIIRIYKDIGENYTILIIQKKKKSKRKDIILKGMNMNTGIKKFILIQISLPFGLISWI